jgi:hypothetical protein
LFVPTDVSVGKRIINTIVKYICIVSRTAIFFDIDENEILYYVEPLSEVLKEIDSEQFKRQNKKRD